jgi:hypothetical protein
MHEYIFAIQNLLVVICISTNIHFINEIGITKLASQFIIIYKDFLECAIT